MKQTLIILQAGMKLLKLAEVNKDKNFQYDLENYDPFGEFHGDTFVGGEKWPEKYESGIMQENDPDYEIAPDSNGNLHEISKFRFPKSKYQEFIEDLGDKYTDPDSEEELIKQRMSAPHRKQRALLRDSIKKIDAYFEELIQLGLNLNKNSEPRQRINAFEQKSNNFGDYIEDVEDFFEDLKVFDEIIGYEETLLTYDGSAQEDKAKEILLKIRVINETLMEDLMINFDKYHNIEKTLADEEEQQRQELYRNLEVDWRPTETIPEDHHAI